MAQPERASTSTVTGSPTQSSVATAEMMSRCQRAIDHAVRTDPEIRVLLSAIVSKGCSAASDDWHKALPQEWGVTATVDSSDSNAPKPSRPTSFVSCVSCPSPARGFFRPGYGVLVCANYLPITDREVSETVRHELVHAFDYCRANIDPNNCTHLACTEIRAAMLSGECNWRREMQRGILGLRGHKQECVRRRAELSVSLHASCSDPGRAQAAVHKAWDSCFADLEPFNRIP